MQCGRGKDIEPVGQGFFIRRQTADKDSSHWLTTLTAVTEDILSMKCSQELFRKRRGEREKETKKLGKEEKTVMKYSVFKYVNTSILIVHTTYCSFKLFNLPGGLLFA